MSRKSTDDTKEQENFYSPEHGMSVQAADLQEAEKKLQALISSEEGDSDKEVKGNG